ncbi:MAG: hypothetical protein U5Q03_19600 [Bacteroidota bacterium]|nr:hypothetical protein [Bacteroidota bacterium]
MKTAELKNHIIRKILNTNDLDLLSYLDNILAKGESAESYKLSPFEREVINESLADYEKGNTIPNNELFSRNKEWLKE